jgi:hypothetical protein
MTFLYIFGFIVLTLLAFKYRNLGTDLKQKRELKTIFHDSAIKIPKIEIGSSYSWTTYTVVFSTRDDYDLAEKNGLFDNFKRRIGQFNKPQKIGDTVVPFNPEQAVYFMYAGQRPTGT